MINGAHLHAQHLRLNILNGAHLHAQHLDKILNGAHLHAQHLEKILSGMLNGDMFACAGDYCMCNGNYCMFEIACKLSSDYCAYSAALSCDYCMINPFNSCIRSLPEDVEDDSADDLFDPHMLC